MSECESLTPTRRECISSYALAIYTADRDRNQDEQLEARDEHGKMTMGYCSGDWKRIHTRSNSLPSTEIISKQNFDIKMELAK